MAEEDGSFDAEGTEPSFDHGRGETIEGGDEGLIGGFVRIEGFEADPLVCPSCGSEMKVIAFILDHAVVDKILRHLKRRAEKGKQRGPPRRSELAAVS